MKALTQDFVVGDALVDVYRGLATAIAAASRGALEPAQVTLILAPPHTGSDLSFRCFELARQWKKNPAQIAAEMAETLKDDDLVANAQAAGPYLNIELDRARIIPSILGAAHAQGDAYGHSRILDGETVMMEYISPNTNKPLHLGHLRNGILGRAVARLIAAQGARVLKTSIINDRGIHIAKSMLAYERWGEDATPESSRVKGDHLVGQLYVRFDQELRKERKAWTARQTLSPSGEKGGKTLSEAEIGKLNDKGKKDLDDRFNEESELLEAARDLLRRWEAGDEEARALWKKMNAWVYDGFGETFEKVGFDFDQHYYESEIFEGGREIILEAAKKGIFKHAENGAVIAPLSEHGKLQDKAVLRADGTGLYITQDINLGTIKFKEHGLTKSIYCIASEQDYYMRQLFATLKLLGFSWADGLYHLSYGMVYLPEGKMKSREGTVVDADDLMVRLGDFAREEILKRHPDLDESELARRSHSIGLAAMVFQMLSVGRDTEILFDPKAAVRFEGKTGPYLQYTHARLSSVLRKAGDVEPPSELRFNEDVEWRIFFQIMLFPAVVRDASEEYDPMLLSTYLYDLAQSFNTFWHDHRVLQSEEPVRSSRVAMCEAFRTVLGNGLRLLAIEPLEEM